MTGKIWAICATKGGPGKSTTTCNLAVELQNKGFSVSVIDADKQGTTNDFFDLRNQKEGITHTPIFQKTGQINLTANDLAKTSDYVLIDIAGRMAPELRYALVCSDLVIIPSRPSFIDLKTLDTLEDELELSEPMAKPNRKVITFLNACDSKRIKAKRHAKSLIIDYSKIPLAKQTIPSKEEFAETMEYGHVISEQKNDRKIAGSFQILLNELLAFEQGQ